MKLACLLAAAAWLQAGAPSAIDDGPARHLRVQRAVHVLAGASGQTCAVLDGDVYAHAESESLNDLRLFAPAAGSSPASTGVGREVPFTLTESNTDRAENDAATVRNLGTEGSAIVFDLDMPTRPYTEVDLALDARDFVGSAQVSGRSAEGHTVGLGEFAVFDLSSQHLSRSTTLPLQESSFPELHVRLQLQPAPGLTRGFESGIVTGATVPPSRAAQTLYTVVAQSAAWKLRRQDSVVTLRLPAHVPVARVQIVLDPAYKANFLRNVTVSARPDQPETPDDPTAGVEAVNGQISQVHLDSEASRTANRNLPEVPIDSLQLSLDAVLAANLRGPATVGVAVANGNDSPLPLRSVQIEMRQRRICFEAGREATVVSGSPANADSAAYTLLYGDKELPAPVYDYSRLFVPSASPAPATLGPEEPNPRFAPREDTRPFTERHPELLWLGLLAVLAALGGVALRSMRQQRGAAH